MKNDNCHAGGNTTITSQDEVIILFRIKGSSLLECFKKRIVFELELIYIIVLYIIYIIALNIINADSI